MKVKILSLILGSLCLSSVAFATETYTSQPVSGYSTGTTTVNSGSNQPYYTRQYGRISVSVNAPDNNFENDSYFIPAHHMGHHHRRGLEWINTMPGEPMPEGAVIGGSEPNRPDLLFVCHGNYGGGVHPGKVVAGRCNISWGGREVALSRYQVLASYYRLNWVPASYGSRPSNAIYGGFENGRKLYICQVSYQGGWHPGKLVGQACNFGYGGKEISAPYYNVLVG